MGYEIPTSQMQYHADYKEMDQKINASYNIEGTVIDNVENIKYFGITITVNFLNIRTPKQFVVITLKFELCGSTIE